jgi:hypothetical protein
MNRVSELSALYARVAKCNKAEAPSSAGAGGGYCTAIELEETLAMVCFFQRILHAKTRNTNAPKKMINIVEY